MEAYSQLRLIDFPAPAEPERSFSFSVGITGEIHGAGSTTTANMLAQIFGFRYEYAGQTIRDMAVQRGFAANIQDDKGLVKFNEQYVRQNPDIDAILDCHIVTEAFKGNCVFEGKAAVVLAKAHKLPIVNPHTEMGWSLVDAQGDDGIIPIFSIVLTCDENIAARRILLRKYLYTNHIDPTALTTEQKISIMDGLDEKLVVEQAAISKQRLQTTRETWEKLYNLSTLEKNEGSYNINIDTTHFTPEQVIGTILCRLVANRQFFSLLSDTTKAKIETMFPGIQNSYPIE